MNTNWDTSFKHVIASEGGYVWDKDDPGGETNLGVTRGAWQEYLGRPVRDGEMKALTVDVVKPFYKARYWDKVKADQLPGGVDYAIFDFAVNAGPGQSAKLLQRVVGAVEDGVIGPKTLALVSAQDPLTLLKKFGEVKEVFYRGIVERRPASAKFLKGWLNRIAHVEANAKKMLT